ncbi:hypothetical protein [Corynebacterium sp. 11A]|uniref:hypothetical protein n=1 Tax=Corynebacterium sp. 11A TaxID=2080510 RepID=UPI00124DDF87|nr:hypothetical protein [Corynebacterium sp. 11A]
MVEQRVSTTPGQSPWVWVWDENELLDRDDLLIAHVRSDVIYVDGQRLLVEYTPGTTSFSFRATAADGEMMCVRQSGFTITSLEAECGDRRYKLDRCSVWRKERAITTSDGAIAAFTRPWVSGRVEIENGPAHAEIPLIDAVVLTWACVVVDSPIRRPRY